MSKEIFLLNKEYIEEEKLVSTIKKSAKILGFKYENKSDTRFKEHQISKLKEVMEDGFEISEWLDIFINNKEEYLATQHPPYSFMPGSGNGSLIVIGYGWGNKDEQVLIPFIREMLKEIPSLTLYAQEWIPTQFYNYLSFTLEDLVEYDGTSSEDFLFNIPYEKEMQKRNK